MALACSANTQLFLLAFAVGVCGSQVTWKSLNDNDADVLAIAVLPGKAVLSHSICVDLEYAEQSGSRELQSRVGGDPRIRDIISWRLWRVHHTSVIL